MFVVTFSNSYEFIFNKVKACEYDFTMASIAAIVHKSYLYKKHILEAQKCGTESVTCFFVGIALPDESEYSREKE
jgi:hypothetical protein